MNFDKFVIFEPEETPVAVSQNSPNLSNHSVHCCSPTGAHSMLGCTAYLSLSLDCVKKLSTYGFSDGYDARMVLGQIRL